MHKESRYLVSSILEIALLRNKMAFISGPRQVGKTTLAKLLKKHFDLMHYENFDDNKFKKTWITNPQKSIESFPLEKIHQKNLLILDEIHKSKFWKQKIKGLYDVYNEQICFVVTGSARLNVYKKGGDSLLGRYFHFRLNPLSLAELCLSITDGPDHLIKNLMNTPNENNHQAILEDLVSFGGFPEVYFAKNKKILNLWRKGRLEKIIREDLRDLTRIHETIQVETLASLLPGKVGSPISISNLRNDLEVSFETVKRWLIALSELYYSFEIKPYSKSIARAIKKEPKIYLYDWSEVENLGSRYENLIAVHLLKACQFWEDTGEGVFELSYLRDKEKREVDFLILKNKKPWFSVECKLTGSNLDTGYQKFQKILNIPHFQVVYEPYSFRKIDDLTYIISAQYFLLALV